MNHLDAEASMADGLREELPGELTYFHGRSEAPYSLMYLATHLSKALRLHCQPVTELPQLSQDVVLISVIYIHRAVKTTGTGHLLNRFTKHRMLLAAFLLTMKFHFDLPLSNKSYASQINGLSLAELNRMEMDFLIRIDWKLKVDPEELVAYRDRYLINNPTTEESQS